MKQYSRLAAGPASRPRRLRLTRARVSVAVFAAVALWGGLAAAPVSASVLTSGLQLIERNYLFASELDAQRLLADSLRYVELRVPEARLVTAGPNAHVLIVGSCRLRLEAPPGASIVDLEPALRHAAALIDDCVEDRPEGLPPTESLLVTGVLSGLDPYSTVFDAERKTEHTIQFQGKLAGIGARIGIRDDRLTLITVYPGSPAARAGLRDDDVVRRIDGESTVNMPVSDAVQRIRGEVGSTVRLRIARTDEPNAIPVSVTRGLVTIPSVTARRMDSGILYAEISHFSQTTPVDFRRRVGELISEGDTNGIVIDLRQNSGGSMLGSSAIGDLFLDDGLLITTAGRNGSMVSGLTAEIRATPDTPFRDLSVAILTSPRTASGSELLAASLRNHDRAILIGERTFGKGTVQKTYGLTPDSSLKMTVGHFLPNGLSIPGGGLAPDIEIRRFVFAEDGVLVPPARDAEELPFWLRTPEWLTASSLRPHAVITLVDLEAKDEEESARGDAVVDIAASLLARYGSRSAGRTLGAAAEWLGTRGRDADVGLLSAFGQHEVDWRSPTSIQALAGSLGPSLEVSIASANGTMVAGEEATLLVTAKNTGRSALFRVHGSLVSEARFLDGRGVLFGRIEPGGSHTWPVRFTPPSSLRTSRVKVAVALENDRDPIALSAPIYLAVQAAPRPRLAHRVSVVSAETPGTLDIRLDVRNDGDGPAEDVRAFLRHPEDDTVELVTATGKIESLAAGETATLELSARLLKSTEKTPELALVLSESAFRTFYESKVELDDARGSADDVGWHEAPDIRIRRMIAGDHGYRLVAEAADSGGLATFWGRIDGHKIDYIDAREQPQRRLLLDVPWNPTADLQRLEIVATDSEGLTTSYVTDL